MLYTVSIYVVVLQRKIWPILQVQHMMRDFRMSESSTCLAQLTLFVII